MCKEHSREKMQPFKVQVRLVRKTVLREEAGQHLWNVSMWNVSLWISLRMSDAEFPASLMAFNEIFLENYFTASLKHGAKELHKYLASLKGRDHSGP